MKALDLLKISLDINKKEREKYKKDLFFTTVIDQLIIDYEEAIKELEEYEETMDKYLDYTTNGRASKSFAADLSLMKSLYDRGHECLSAIESQSSCDGCIHKPKQGENYYDPCGECKRFYGDCYKDGR